MLQKPQKTGPPNTFEIKHLLECKKCVESCPAGKTLREWQAVTVGLTPYGLQVWCARHQCNILHADFRGARVVMNMSAPKGVVWQGTH